MTSAVARALAIAARRWDAAATLARLGGDASAAETEPIVDEARPRHWRGCDPSWLDAAVADLDPRAQAIVLGERDDPLARHLARRALGHLVAMPALGPARGAVELPRLNGRALARTLAVLGRRQLAHALAAAAPDELAALARRLPWGGELTAEVVAVRSLGAAVDDELGSRRSAARRTQGLTWREPGAAVTAGARALAPRLVAAPEVVAQLAQRLPRPIGLAVAAELTGPFARSPADGVSDGELRRAIDRGSVGP